MSYMEAPEQVGPRTDNLALYSPICPCFRTLIFLHGVGDNGDNWLTRLQAQPGLRDFKVVIHDETSLAQLEIGREKPGNAK